MTVTEWADARRYLSSEALAMAGKYRSRQTPYMVEIMEERNEIDSFCRLALASNKTSMSYR